jgi:hypothetical protein
VIGAGVGVGVGVGVVPPPPLPPPALIATGHALAPVEVGPLVDAAVEVIATSVESVAPVSSVTVKRSRSVPAVGASAVTIAALAPETMAPPVPAATTLHE